MPWIWIAVAAALVVLLASVWFQRDSDPIPSGDQIELETLESTLESAGVEHHSTRIPNADILQPHIAEGDEFLGAIQARRGNKRAILVALEDRLVAGESTLGSMGVEVVTVYWEEIREFEQTYDIGGELHLATDREEYVFTHLPRSQTAEFAQALAHRLEIDTET